VHVWVEFSLSWGVACVVCMGSQAQLRQGWGCGEAGYRSASVKLSLQQATDQHCVLLLLTCCRRLHALCAHTIDSCLSRCGTYPALVYRQHAVCIFACWRLCYARLCSLLLCRSTALTAVCCLVQVEQAVLPVVLFGSGVFLRPLSSRQCMSMCRRGGLGSVLFAICGAGL
jgi:hypothetical protein